MKKVFAVFCACILLPNFTTYAWVGGPFSNNSYFGENGDDGIYEATASTKNGVGLFRWGVVTSYDGVVPALTDETFTSGGASRETTIATASNVFFGVVGGVSHSWFIEGISYEGTCFGSVNSGLGLVSCVGTAFERQAVTFDPVFSSFKAQIIREGDGIPITRFEGTGRVRSDLFPVDERSRRFFVIGSKVGDQVIFGV